jgi:hypothetical protein
MCCAQAILVTDSPHSPPRLPTNSAGSAHAVARRHPVAVGGKLPRDRGAGHRHCLAVSNATRRSTSSCRRREPRALLDDIINAGSVFLGAWSPEPMGDYCSGTNHVLPTYGYARAYSGLSLLDFQKRMTVQELTPMAARAGPVAETLAASRGSTPTRAR